MTSAKTTKKGFTIIELLTVLSIIIILISILVPGLNRARVFAKKVTQKGQFHEISKGLELFRNDHQETLPDSGAADTDTAGPYGYCGAMKLCEAMLGQDGMGYHPSSRFFSSGKGSDATGTEVDLYPLDLCVQTNPSAYSGPTADPLLVTNMRERNKYIESDNIKATRLSALYSWYDTAAQGASYYDGLTFQTSTNTYPYAFPNAVITDVYLHASSLCGGKKLGMPVLYYKADPSKLVHDPNYVPAVGTPNPNIYNFDDNHAITGLGCPWDASATVTPHPMYTNPYVFYKAITNKNVTSTPRPHNEDGYILISAGYDGLYGTRDDVFNFAD
jgi:prepilin-type N-terminal cleavage/methylation domain-containing protein